MLKVIAVNGSAKKAGNTALALSTVSEALQSAGIEVERIDVGDQPIHGCVGCGLCRQKRISKCKFTDDDVNEWVEKMIRADGLLIGSPVYYAGINGALKAFLDRAFYVAGAGGALFRHKVGAGVVAVRRAGAIAALDQIHKYFGLSEMFVPGSNYWNLIYGMAPGEAAKDEEGKQCLQLLGANMAWLLKAIEQGKKTLPPPVDKTAMNFIR